MDLSRRKFLNLFGMGAASIIVPPPKKSYFFFGNLWRPDPRPEFEWKWDETSFEVAPGPDGMVFVATLKTPDFLMAGHAIIGGMADGSQA